MLCDCRSGVLWYWSFILSEVLKKLLNADFIWWVRQWTVSHLENETLLLPHLVGHYKATGWREKSERETHRRGDLGGFHLKSTRRFTLLDSFFVPRDKRTWKLSSYYLPSLPETTGLDNTTVCLCSYSPSWYPGKSQPFHMPSSKG